MEKTPEVGQTPTLPSLEQKKKGVEDLRSSVEKLREELQKRREAKQRERAREEVCYWMDNAIFPFLEGIADSFNEPLIAGIHRLIREGKNPFKPKENGWNRTKETETALTAFLLTPQTKVLITLAKPFLKQKMEWINQEATWIRETILKEEYPDIYSAIISIEGGKEWLDQLIADFIKTLRTITR